jgi:HAD superfamily hydrolase (TIGR01509 family)
MDGLLLDTEELWDRAEGALFRRYGEEWTSEDKLAVMGTSVEVSGRHYAARLRQAPDRADDLVAEVRDLMKTELAQEVAARPGALELLRRLREMGSVRLALASNSSREIVDLALATAGLGDAFDAVVTADDVAEPKPAPDIYLEACARLGVAPSDAVALEDAAPGIAAAKAAGLTCIAVPGVAGVDASAADRVVDSLERLLEGDEAAAQ